MLPYKGLKGIYERMIVSEAQVNAQVDALLEQHTRSILITDRPSQVGDELVLDYAGYCDGIPFDGGSAQNQTLVLGSGAFIPGFEEQLLGKHPGDDVHVHVTFPASYHARDLAGRDALFHCRIHAIRIWQKYNPDDTFAREVTGYDSFMSLWEAIRQGLQAYADRQADEDLKLRLLDQLTDQFETDITPEQLKNAVDIEIDSLKSNLSRNGLSLDAYCRFTGKNEAQLREDCLPDARKRIARQAVLSRIIEEEDIQADEESVAEAIQLVCRQNNMTPEQLSPHMDEKAQQAIIQSVLTQKALDCLRQYAIVETIERQG